MSLPHVTFCRVALLMVGLVSNCSAAEANDASAPTKPWTVNSSVGSPYSRQDGTGPMDLILKEIFRRAQIPARVASAPAERSLFNLSEGIDDADGFRAKELEGTVPHILCVPEPVIEARFCAYTRRSSNMNVTSLEDLRPLHVGVLRGRPVLVKRLAHVRQLTEVNAQDSLFQMLEAGRVDSVVSETYVAHVLIRALGFTDLVESSRPMGAVTLHLYINDKHRSMLPRLNEAISAMTAEHFVEGTFTEESMEMQK